MEKYLPLLTDCGLFAGIQPPELEGLLRCLRSRVAAFEKNQTVVHEADPARFVGVVLSGTVQVVRDDFYGRRSVLGAVGPGQIFGEVFACAQIDAMPVSVIATSPAQILLLDCRRIVALCPNSCAFHSRLIRNLLQIVAQKTLMLNQKLELTAQRTTRDKLMAYLLQEAKRQGRSTFTIPYDRQQLADYLGVDRSAMSTELGKLKREGILDFSRNRFTISVETL